MKKEKLNITRGAINVAPLITAKELNAILGQSHIKIFDVRGTWGTDPRSLYNDYLWGHIPTATFLDWRKEFIEQDIAPNLAQVSTYEAAKQSFKTLGINKEDTVILYDDYHHMFAGRIWWAMRYWGFKNVRVLNGGYKYWQLEGLPISQEFDKTLAGTFEPICQEHLRVSLPDFLIKKDSACVLDGRGIAGYNGKPEDPRTGHIPGAISAAYNSLLDKNTGLFLEKEAIIKLFDETIPNWRTSNIISSCGAGYSGTVVMIALANLGIQASLFDGSFSVWKQDPERPVVQSF
ncbi:sulfurtransferase [Aquimarina sp. AD10]|uniref:sulfurtransferase n=1 Tax=Aquimarina sp. AD10 TaxID=1714849 RepID=UPI000E4D2219|nr:rhodanese-like domain-containing protein [Aquimarina sp. AD10]AXT62585.1 sulfurtransferase [Aquimarina sp. AD10]RKM97769.1 sulfurtransferase [Aquimarina sp. AD10]